MRSNHYPRRKLWPNTEKPVQGSISQERERKIKI